MISGISIFSQWVKKSHSLSRVMKSINYGDDDSDMKYVHDLGKLWLFYSAHL